MRGFDSPAAGTLGCDSFTVETMGLIRLYVLFLNVELDRGRVELAGIPTIPTGQWVTHAARNLLMDLGQRGDPLRYLVRDRDAKFTTALDTVC